MQELTITALWWETAVLRQLPVESLPGLTRTAYSFNVLLSGHAGVQTIVNTDLAQPNLAEKLVDDTELSSS